MSESHPLPSSTVAVHPDHWTQPFWGAGTRGQLVAARCVECATFRMPPGPFCHTCRNQAVEWVELPGTATVYSRTVVRHAVLDEAATALPYEVVVVTLDGAPGCRLIVAVAAGEIDVEIGAPVRVVWDTTRQPALPIAVPTPR